MKKIILAALGLLLSVGGVYAQSAGNTLAERAAQFYARGEWPSSRAAYMTLARENKGTTDYLVRAITSSLMEGNGTQAREETLAGVDRHVPIDTIFNGVFNATIELGKNDMYERYLLDMRASEKWMGRVIDRSLLNYYVFRDDAENIVKTATSLLNTTPDNMLFLPSLAYGQLLSGDMAGMVNTNKHILELDSNNLDALLYLGNYYYGQWKQGKPEEKEIALRYLSQAQRQYRTPYIDEMLAELMQ